jgi:hypothetical protein
MPRSLELPLAVLICCVSVWFFAEALWNIDDQRKLLTQQIMDETTLTIGIKEPCIAEVPLSIWGSMNTLGVYAWVAACEESTK